MFEPSTESYGVILIVKPSTTSTTTIVTWYRGLFANDVMECTHKITLFRLDGAWFRAVCSDYPQVMKPVAPSIVKLNGPEQLISHCFLPNVWRGNKCFFRSQMFKNKQIMKNSFKRLQKILNFDLIFIYWFIDAFIFIFFPVRCLSHKLIRFWKKKSFTWITKTLNLSLIKMK